MTKTSIKLILFLFIVFFEVQARKNVATPNASASAKLKDDIVILTSIPKCGSHLAEKCISMLTRRKKVVSLHIKTNSQKFLTGSDLADIEQKIERVSSNRLFGSGHITYSKELDNLATQKKYKFIFIYRDPRAQVASLARWWMPLFNIDNDLSKSISSLISDGRLYQFKWDNIYNVTDLYNAFLPWIDSPNTLTIRFEDLVGEKGGGCLKTQYETITKIAQFLDIKINESRLKYICANLFGDTRTFYKGQIDGWKESFTEEHKKAFKLVAGQLLIDLGYESGLDW